MILCPISEAVANKGWCVPPFMFLPHEEHSSGNDGHTGLQAREIDAGRRREAQFVCSIPLHCIMAGRMQGRGEDSYCSTEEINDFKMNHGILVDLIFDRSFGIEWIWKILMKNNLLRKILKKGLR